jgi:hypothetical protein
MRFLVRTIGSQLLGNYLAHRSKESSYNLTIRRQINYFFGLFSFDVMNSRGNISRPET